jgi:hypothetical protein
VALAVARRSTPGAMRDMDPDRRYSMLLAALAAAHTEIVDEVVQLFDQALLVITVAPSSDVDR